VAVPRQAQLCSLYKDGGLGLTRHKILSKLTDNDADIPALRKLYPDLHTFEQWLHLTGWINLPVLPMPANTGWAP
jgi:hypothetical protein